MKNKLVTLSAAFMLAAVLGSIYAAPALAAVIKAALIKNIDEPGRNPFQFKDQCITAGLDCFLTLPAAPAGKRLVIENVNAVVELNQGGTLSYVSVSSSGALAYFAGELVRPGNATTTSFYAVNGSFRHYVESGEASQISARALNAPGGMVAIFTVTGYFVDLTI